MEIKMPKGNKTAKVGEEYKILKQKSTPKKIAKCFIVLWVLCVMTPVLYFSLTKSVQIKEYAVVKGFYEANAVLMKQYNDFSNQVISSIDIAKYTSKIDIPQIKLDKVSQASTKVNQTTQALSALGVKGVDKVTDTSAALQQQIDKANAQIKDATLKAQKALQTDIQSALKKEVTTLANGQVQKQLNLSNKAYKIFSAGNFGLLKGEARANTSLIYSELAKNSKGVFKDGISLIDKYFKWISWAVSALLFIILLIPVVLAWWIAKKLSANFTECPYCGKVFLSKAGKFNLLKMLK